MRFAPTCALVLALVTGAQAQQQPRFVSGTSLVPVNVRVVDDHGNPITDLTREDFSVLEDGVPQPIRVFDAHALAPASRELNRPGGVVGPTTAVNILPQERRVFLIVLGRGRLNQV